MTVSTSNPTTSFGDKLIMADIENKSDVCCGCKGHAEECRSIMVVDTGEISLADAAGLSKGSAVSPVNSEGKDEVTASVAGCNLNNSDFGRTLNANNSVGNSDWNYAGGFAPTGLNQKGFASRPSRPNKNEGRIATGGYGRSDYGSSLPYCCDENTERNADNVSSTVWEDLRIANEKRKLKGLRKFYLSKEIAVYAVKRACMTRDTKNKVDFYERAAEIADKLIDDVKNGTYYVHGYEETVLEKKHKTSKERTAKIYRLYDRCMQNMVLTIIEQKLRKMVIRNNYSNIEKRGILCNDKRFCMMNKVRDAVVRYNGLWYLNTDISKFYQSVKVDTVIEVLSRTIKDKTTMDIISKTLYAAGDLPIGCCLSPLFSSILLIDYDRKILNDFKPRFYAIFGDNRLFIGRKDILQKILSFTRKYYVRRYGFTLNDAYQLGKVSDGLTFCKTKYKNGFASVRGELKRRAIRAANKQRSFAGYNGILEKTDSKHLLSLIKTNLKGLKKRRNIFNIVENTSNSMGEATNNVMEGQGVGKQYDCMDVNAPFIGNRLKIQDLLGKSAYVMKCKPVDNHKDSGYYILFQVMVKRDNDEPALYSMACGGHYIKKAYEDWKRDNVQFPIFVTVCVEGTSYYFKEYRTSNREQCNAVIEAYNIDISKL